MSAEAGIGAVIVTLVEVTVAWSIWDSLLKVRFRRLLFGLKMRSAMRKGIDGED